MSVYIIGIVLILGLWSFLKRYRNGKRIYCVIISAYLLLLAGLRSPALGINDTLYYTRLYPLIKNMSFADIINHGFLDPGFEVFGKLLTYISTNAQIWILGSAIPLAVAVGRLIYQKSVYPDLSFILFMSLGYYGYQFTMMRQMMAVGLGLLAYLQYDEKKYKSAIVLITLAGCMHITSLVLLVIPLAEKLKIINRWKLLAAIGIPGFFLASNLILKRMFSLLDIYRFARYEAHISSFNYSLFYLHLIILIFATVFFYMSFGNNEVNRYESDEAFNVLFYCSTINVMILTLINQFALLYRVAAYFGIFEIILLPNTYRRIRISLLRSIVKISTIVAFVGYLFISILQSWNMVPYEFYWNFL